LDVYATLRGPFDAMDMAKQRSGRWFDPDLVRIVTSWSAADPVWTQGDPDEARRRLDDETPGARYIWVSEGQLDSICEAFAEVIDAKSPYTYRHSTGVASAAVAIAHQLGLSAYDETIMRRAALLHDIGKLSVSNAILEKPGRLTGDEWKAVMLHPYYTEQILRKVPVFRDFAAMAAAHHEKLDGSGYCKSLTADQLSLEARILTVADIFDALFADRPYRAGLPMEKVMSIIETDVPRALDGRCYEALKEVSKDVDFVTSLQWLKRASD
jgi:putative nucleotidyltransferase with HDIG domain